MPVELMKTDRTKWGSSVDNGDSGRLVVRWDPTPELSTIIVIIVIIIIVIIIIVIIVIAIFIIVVIVITSVVNKVKAGPILCFIVILCTLVPIGATLQYFPFH